VRAVATKILCATPAAVTGNMATFGVDTDLVAPYKFHWKKDGAFIGGAPSAKSYTTPPLKQEDLRAKFSVLVFGQDRVEESDALALNEKIPDAVTVPNQGPPKPAWQPFVEPKGTN